jgi:hypothetical protein
MGLFWCLVSFLQALLPETFYDSMVYHLAVPCDWMMAHGFRDFPGQIFSHFPYGGELFWMNGWVLSGSEGAKALHVAVWSLNAVLLAGWAREWGGVQRGWVALGLGSTLPLGVVCSWSSANEGLLVLALLLCCYSAFRVLEGNGSAFRWAFLSGLFAGAALGIKYTAVVTLAVFFCLFAARGLRAGRQTILHLALYWVFGGGIGLFPWLVKNACFSGNPFFPYFSQWLGNGGLVVPGLARLIREQQGWVTQGFSEFWKLPWTLTMGSPNSYNFIGPLALALAPLLILFWPRDRRRSD